MADDSLPVIVIPKEEAVFWMDRFGRWHNASGRFEHKKIIDYFNASIRRDELGYFVEQIREVVREKVYFKYEDTPLFVVDAVISDCIELILNTTERIILKPEALFVYQDNLYLQRTDEKIRFSDRVLLKLADFMEFDEQKYYFITNDQHYVLPEITGA